MPVQHLTIVTCDECGATLVNLEEGYQFFVHGNSGTITPGVSKDAVTRIHPPRLFLCGLDCLHKAVDQFCVPKGKEVEQCT